MDNSILLIFVFIIGLVLVVGIVDYRIGEKQRKTVFQNSIKIPSIDELNKHYTFIDFQPEIKFTKCCNSKKEFDRTVLQDFLYESVRENLDYCKTLIDSVQFNREVYDSYYKAYSKIVDSFSESERDLYSKYEFFEDIEMDICEKNRLSPTISLTIRVEKTYTSPQGRNYYKDHLDFSLNDLINCCAEVEREEKENSTNKATVEYQRRIMTDSIRYDVLKRDGFRCVLCGASKQDGVKLEVDHIRPVSKGGKTELSNLRTLCERCNRGKRDKFDPYGEN